jgi:hypothetical protein
VDLVSGSNLAVGKGLQSCTDAVKTADAFLLDGHRVVLIDTPGFDDTTKSDTDILKMIAAFLQQSYVKLRHGLKNGDCAFLTKHAPMCRYKEGATLAGILYFHRISDFRMGGISMRNLRLLRQLCGGNTLKNVVIVTNRWEEVKPGVGEAREAELASDDMFFKHVLDKGAQMARHDNTIDSAKKILHLILRNNPLPLRIQAELVTDEGKRTTMNINETDRKRRE